MRLCGGVAAVIPSGVLGSIGGGVFVFFVELIIWGYLIAGSDAKGE